MALCSPSAIPIVIVVSLLLAPAFSCIQDRDQRRSIDRRELQQDFYGCRLVDGTPCRPYSDFPPSIGVPQTPIPARSSQTQPPPSETCNQGGTCPPPQPRLGGEPDPPQTEPPAGTTPAAPSLPPPPVLSPSWPSNENPQRPKGDANLNRNVTSNDGTEQGKNNKSNIASSVGWVFLATALALQVVLGSYLAYKRRELERFGPFGTRLGKVPSVPPPPFPAGF